jgi:ribosome-associated toxin RatA of RatAB toxin-antitoxin module
MTVFSPLLPTITDRLSSAERDALSRKQPVVTGQNGDYVGWILVEAPQDVVWDVLTDYSNFSQFLPTVVSSCVLVAEGNRKVVEQVDRRRVLLMDITSTVQTENLEQAPDQIRFRLVSGDLNTLQGSWQIHGVEMKASDCPQVVITQTVTVEANAGFLNGMFYRVFEDSLKENLIALQQESERRL